MLGFNVKKIRWAASLLTFIFLLDAFAVAAPSLGSSPINVIASQNYVGQIQGVGDIWKGLVPTKISYPSDSSFTKLEFPIQGLLPIDTLRNSLTGVEVDFEIWTDAGKKIGYDNVYSSDWNPAGPNTLVSMYVSGDGAVGTQTLIIRTLYNLRNNGLLTQYLKQETKQPIQIVAAKASQTITFSSLKDRSISDGTFTLYSFDVSSSQYNLPVTVESITPTVCTVSNLQVSLLQVGLCQLRASQPGNDVYDVALPVINSFQVLPPPPSTPGLVTGISGSIGFQSLNFTFKAPQSNPPNTGYDVGISRLLSPTADPTSSLNYTSPSILKNVSSELFSVSFDEVKTYLQSVVIDISKVTVLIRVRAVNSYGSGNWSSGVYFPPDRFQFSPPPSQKSSPSSPKLVSITCIKGKLIKKISAVKPVCPASYKRK